MVSEVASDCTRSASRSDEAFRRREYASGAVRARAMACHGCDCLLGQSWPICDGNTGSPILAATRDQYVAVTHQYLSTAGRFWMVRYVILETAGRPVPPQTLKRQT